MNRPPRKLRPTTAEITQRPFSKSSFSGGQGSCVGVKCFGEWTVVGKHELGDASPTLVFPSIDWNEFCALVERGERTDSGAVEARFTLDGGFTLTEANNQDAPTIAYDRNEWNAFKLGVDAGELRSSDPHGTLVADRP